MARKFQGRREIIAHIGSAHTPGELAALVAIAKQRIQGDQQTLDLDLDPSPAAVLDLPAASSPLVQRSSSRILLQALEGTYKRLGFDAIDDPVFRDLVLARLVERPANAIPSGYCSFRMAKSDLKARPIFHTPETRSKPT